MADFFQNLQTELYSLLAGTDDNVRLALQQALDAAKSHFTTFFDLEPRKQSEKDELLKHAAQPGPAQEALHLSDLLNASETFCAVLVDHVQRHNPDVNGDRLAERALMVYYEERAAMISCLRFVIERATDPEAQTKQFADLMIRHTLGLVAGPYDMGKGKGRENLVSKLVAEIDHNQTLIASQRTALPQPTNQASSFGAPAPQPFPFSRTILELRISYLQRERRNLAHVVYLVAASGMLKSTDVTSLVKWLSQVKDLSEGVTMYMITSFFTAINPSDAADASNSDEATAIYRDRQLFVSVNGVLNTTWALPRLRAALLLQWSLYVLQVRNRDPNLLGNRVVVEDEVGKIAKEAIRSDAFHALTTFLLRSRGTTTSDTPLEYHIAPDDTVLMGKAAYATPIDQNDTVQDDFRPYVLRTYENLILDLIRNMSRVLRDIRKQEEDYTLSTMRNMRSFSPQGSAPPEPAQLPRRDTETLFRLVAILYDEFPPDTALKFWPREDAGLLTFLKWAGESRHPGMTTAMYDMFSSLSRGPNCAAATYNFLSSGGGHYGSVEEPSSFATSTPCSWSMLFQALHHYEGQATASRLPSQPGGPSDLPRFALHPDEIMMLTSFLRLLRNVARYSVTARIALHENPNYRAIQTLFNLCSMSIPLELKAMLFDALCAFSAPGGGQIGVDIVHQMWAVLEKMEIIPIRSGAPNGVFSGRVGRAVGGAVIELEQVESVGRAYPATIALVTLLNSLIHTPAKALTLRGGFEVESQTIPDHLGSGYRFPGLRPYVDFVIDKVFLKVFERGYNFPHEQWLVLEGCLGFMEKSLASYDLSVLHGEEFSSWKSGNPASQAKVISILSGLTTHPGFFTLRAILSSQAVRKNLLYVVESGFDQVFSNIARVPALSKAALRSLRIIHRVFQIQGLFAEGLVPLLNEAGDLNGLGSMGFPLSSILPLDQAILNNTAIVGNVGSYATAGDPELSLFSIKILAALAESPYFTAGVGARPLNPLVAALRDSLHWPQILSGFVHWLNIDSSEEFDIADEGMDVIIGEPRGQSSPLIQTIQSAIMQILLQNTQSSRPAPNFAHLLLGLDTRMSSADLVVPDPLMPSVHRSCLHVILEQLGAGIPRKDQRTPVLGIPLFINRPAFAEKCYQLVYQLCTHPYTSTAMIRYLRTREHFFIRQLSAAPIRAPELQDGILGRVTYPDGQQLTTTNGALTAFLRLRSWILKSAALEIHILTETNQQTRAERLVNVLFGTADDGTTQASIDDELIDAPVPGQSLIRVLELLDSLSFDWEDSLVPVEAPLQFYGSLNWDSCLRADERGCIIYDFRQLISMLSRARRQLQKEGALSIGAAQQQLKDETEFIFKSAALENHRRAVDHAKGDGYASWAMLLNVSLLKAFDRVSNGRSESILYDLLQALPPCIMAPTTSPSTSISLAVTMVSLITKLRETLRQERLLHNPAVQAFSSVLPTDRLHTILKGVLECLLHQGTTEKVRGNLYAVLINYLHITLDSLHAPRPHDADAFSPDASSFADTGFTDDVFGRQGGTSLSSFVSGTLSIINIVVERLVPIVCRDAIDGSEVWKTVAFTLLDVLVRLSRNEKTHRVLAVLSRNGYLQTFVHSLRENGPELRLVLKPDPPSLNALYVYEAKMALLIRIAQTRQGADRLFESRVFACLAQCDFLDARPSADVDFLDHDSFLPTAVERYHQILIPALELAISCLSIAGPTISTVTKQALQFVYAHRDIFSGLLLDHAQPMSYATLREYQLIVALATLVQPEVKAADLADPVYFKQIHMVIISLSARCLNRQKWDPQINIVNSVERTELETRAIGYGENGNVYQAKFLRSVRLLQRWLVMYLFGVVDITRDNFAPILLPNTSRGIEGSTTQVLGKAPTIIDCMSVLSDFTQEAEDTLNHLHDITAKLEDIDRVPSEEIQDIISSSTETRLEYVHLDGTQKKSIVWKELERALDRRRTELLGSLQSIEQLLLIAWRHLDTFLADSEAHTHSLSASFSRSQRLDPSTFSKETLRERCASILLPALDSLEKLDLVTNLEHNEAASRRSFIRLMSRRLKEAVTRDGDWEMVA